MRVVVNFFTDAMSCGKLTSSVSFAKNFAVIGNQVVKWRRQAPRCCQPAVDSRQVISFYMPLHRLPPPLISPTLWVLPGLIDTGKPFRAFKVLILYWVIGWLAKVYFTETEMHIFVSYFTRNLFILD